MNYCKTNGPEIFLYLFLMTRFKCCASFGRPTSNSKEILSQVVDYKDQLIVKNEATKLTLRDSTVDRWHYGTSN